MKRILIIDNFDSFTHNLEHYVTGLDCDVTVVRNDVIKDDVLSFDAVILSPGPGMPNESTGMIDLLEKFNSRIPILGVCLGMQAIGELLGGELYNQEMVKHGVQAKVTRIKESLLFQGINEEFNVGLYHSWALREKGDYSVVAKSDQGVVMAIENADRKLFGVQFHPESILTENGKLVLQNFLNQI